MIYGLVGQSLWETGTLAIRESTVPYYSLPTPALVGLPLTAGDLASGLAVAQALQALAMSFVAVPVYLWASRLAGARWALAAAVLAKAAGALVRRPADDRSPLLPVVAAHPLAACACSNVRRWSGKGCSCCW